MTARIKGFISRAEAGLVPPRSISRNITPSRGGVTIHYGGPAQRITSHSQCIARWRSWQSQHMRPGGLGTKNGASDIAYTIGVCDHGYALAGRGAGVRTAANGTNAGNQNYYAATWIGGAGEVPTQAAKDAMEWVIQELRRNGGAGLIVNDHSKHKPTACAGDEWRKWIAAGRPTSDGPSSEQEDEDEMRPGHPDVNAVARLQSELNAQPQVTPKLKIDGLYGKETERAVRQLQAHWHYAQTGIFDQATARRMDQVDVSRRIGAAQATILDTVEDMINEAVAAGGGEGISEARVREIINSARVRINAELEV